MIRTLSSFILREFTGNLVEFGAVAQLFEGFFFFGVFLALGLILSVCVQLRLQ
jgi:hypothetical protein